MRIKQINEEERARAFASERTPEVCQAQKLNVRYHVEDYKTADRPRRFLEAFATILKHSNYRLALDHYIRLSAKCARCATPCQIYNATHDPKDVPCYRTELLLGIYRRHFTLGGMLRGRALGTGHLTEEKIEEMADSFWNCTACRRCALECPVGIDHGLVTHLGRYILSEIGIVPKTLVAKTREQLTGATGNSAGVTVTTLKDSLQSLEKEMREETGKEIKFPLDVENAQYVFYPPASDIVMEPETLKGIAAVFKATGDNWTISTSYFDAVNLGLFYSDRVMERVAGKIDADTRRLNGRTILVGESGHAARTARYFMPTFCGGEDALPTANIIEYTHNAWLRGKLKLKPGVIAERVSYHDPCNIARQAWIIQEPRDLLMLICDDFVELKPHGDENICCGGGGGTVALDELKPYRMEVGGRVKAEQIRKSGCKILVAPCSNCKKQLRQLVEYWKIDCQVVGLHDLLYRAIVFEQPKPVPKKIKQPVHKES